MAILKMKKLRLMAVRSKKDELLRELIRHGCVEFSELEEEIQGSEIENVVSRESSDVAALKSQYASLNHAIALLNSYAPGKEKLLSAKPELEDTVFLEDGGLAGALKFAEAIEGYDARIKRIGAEESRQRSVRKLAALAGAGAGAQYRGYGALRRADGYGSCKAGTEPDAGSAEPGGSGKRAFSGQ